MSDKRRYARPRPGLYGSSEFVEFLGQVPAQPARRDRGVAGAPEAAEEHGVLELGVSESEPAEGFVNVRLDSTAQIVRARFGGFVPGYLLVPGDELCVELVDDEWRTVPEVRHTIKHRDRIEFWGVNRLTGEFRLLAENHYE